MAKINLLPWREELRTQKRQEFFSITGIAALATAALFFLFYLFIEAKIDYQNTRNQYMEAEIAKLDKKITEIRELEKERERLISRMRTIETLQTSRPIIVHLFDEIVTSLPDGVFLKEINQTGAAIILKGTARSNARVSNFMRNIEKSLYMMSAKLTVIQTATRENRRLSDFELRLTQTAPKKQSEDADEEDLI